MMIKINKVQKILIFLLSVSGYVFSGNTVPGGTDAATTCEDCASERCCLKISQQLVAQGGEEGCDWVSNNHWKVYSKCLMLRVARPTNCERAEDKETCRVYARISVERGEKPCYWTAERGCGYEERFVEPQTPSIPYLNQRPDICKIYKYDSALDIVDIACRSGECERVYTPHPIGFSPVGFLENLHHQLGNDAWLEVIECVPVMRLRNNNFILSNGQKLPGGDWFQYCGIKNIRDKTMYVRCRLEHRVPSYQEEAFDQELDLDKLLGKNLNRSCMTSGYFDNVWGPRRHCILKEASPYWFW